MMSRSGKQVDGLLSRDEIINFPRLKAGMVRHTVHNDDGSKESVAINNLMAIKNVYCTDFAGNQFGCYFVVPDSYWRIMKREWSNLYRNDWKWLPKNRYGGYMGIFPYVTVYVGGIDDVVVMKPDVGRLVFEFKVGDEHRVDLSKDALIKELGYKIVGYDNRVPYVPWWSEMYGYDAAYAPPHLLLEWKNYDGFEPAVRLLADPPSDALRQWYRQGLIAAPEKEAVVALLEGREYFPQIEGPKEDG